jgi:hypothetical protein
MRRHLRQGLLLASLALLSSTAVAYKPTGSRWQQLPVTYRVNQSTFPASIQNTALASIEAGFASWSEPSCTSFLCRGFWS